MLHTNKTYTKECILMEQSCVWRVKALKSPQTTMKNVWVLLRFFWIKNFGVYLILHSLSHWHVKYIKTCGKFKNSEVWLFVFIENEVYKILGEKRNEKPMLSYRKHFRPCCTQTSHIPKYAPRWVGCVRESWRPLVQRISTNPPKTENVPIVIHTAIPAPTGKEEGRIRPAASDSLRYFSIASCSGLERLYRWLEGNGAPGSSFT